MKSKLLISVLLISSSFPTVSSANAASQQQYRYWSYWQKINSNWTYSTTGASHVPSDGAIEGWLFTISNSKNEKPTPPEISKSFSELCDATPIQAEKKRVGVVIDFGNVAYQPVGEKLPANLATCVLVPNEASGYEILALVSKVRVNQSGFVCGLNGYPETECGAKFDGSAQASVQKPSWLIWLINIGLAVVLLILISRRRNASQ
mgnify:FL=1